MARRLGETVGWHEREYPEKRGGGWKAAWQRIFVDGEHFLNWKFPLFRALRITVYLHVFFVLFAVFKVGESLFAGAGPGIAHVLLMLTCVFGIVLIHEYGHCLACRYVGGQADEVILWPLGGLALCRPPHRWQADLITTLGGPAVHPVIFVFTSAAILAMGGEFFGTVVFNPLNRGSLLIDWANGSPARFLVMIHVVNIYLFLFNMCLPMYPMDAGRVVQAIIWWRTDNYQRSLLIACNVGLFFAVGVGLFAMLTNESMLLTICVFAGMTCWFERSRARLMEYGDPYAQPSAFGGLSQPDHIPERGPSKKEIRMKQRQEEMQAEVDRILEKVHKTGLQSLTRKEKKTLEEASAQKGSR